MASLDGTDQSGGPGVSLLQRIARTLNVFLVLGVAIASSAALQCAYAQAASSTQSSAQSSAQPAPSANAAPSSQAAPNADPPIDKSQIAQRLNRELDFNLENNTAAWQHALERVDGELARARLRYGCGRCPVYDRRTHKCGGAAMEVGCGCWMGAKALVSKNACWIRNLGETTYGFD